MHLNLGDLSLIYSKPFQYSSSKWPLTRHLCLFATTTTTTMFLRLAILPRHGMASKLPVFLWKKVDIVFFFSEFRIPAIVSFSFSCGFLNSNCVGCHNTALLFIKSKTFGLFVDNWENYSGPVLSGCIPTRPRLDVVFFSSRALQRNLYHKSKNDAKKMQMW